MNHNQIILDFLKDLSQNNCKEWMDDNRNRYQTAKNLWLDEVQKILNLLCKHDEEYYSKIAPKTCISRITNNRIFNAKLPIYKDFFTFSVMDKIDCFSPLHISFGVSGSFVGCGYHNPDKQTLSNIRDAIDYEGQTLKDILENNEFKNFFGGLSTFTEPLKTSPKGYPKDHPFVDYLRYKNYCVDRKLSTDDLISDSFMKIVEESYQLSTPFREFLKRANSV
jgi:uncharacterized protein (TIGR02453 family)